VSERALVTGYNGFVGSHLAAAVEIIPFEDAGGLVDLLDAPRVAEVIAALKPDVVYHLAGQAYVGDALADPRTTYEINFFGTLNLIEALKAAGFGGRMLFAGSGDVYGRVPESELPVREDRPLRPLNPYAVSKAAAEALCYQTSRTSGFEVLLARPFNHIGAGQSPKFVVSDFARRIAMIAQGKAAPVLEVGDVDITRDFTDVRDVTRAYQLLLAKGRAADPYNICSGVERTIRSVIEMLSRIAGVKVELRVDQARLRPGEQRRVRGDSSRLQRDTGWQPQIDFQQSLTDVFNHWNRELACPTQPTQPPR
jgi:GDP-4-dehydro-6-deoxy-D-mannose reductase